MLTAHASAASRAFYPYPDSTLDFSRSLVWQSPRQAPQSTVIFHQELTKPATNVLNPIKAVTTRGSGITAYRASGNLLPLAWRLAPVLPTTYSFTYLR